MGTKKNNNFIIVLILIAVVVAAIFYFRGQGAQNGDATQAGMQMTPEVTVMKLTTSRIHLEEELPGRASAYKMAEIRPQVSGIITERLFTEGHDVEEGQQLYQIDPAAYQAAYDSASADLQKARANMKLAETKYKRYQALIKTDAISKQAYDDIEASLAQARADIAIAKATVAAAKINLNYTKVYAPIAGRIGKSNVTKGALVTANQEQLLATITQLDPIYVDMTQSSSEMMQLRRSLEGQEKIPVRLVFENGAGAYDPVGEMQFSEVTVDETTGSVQIRALFPNPDGALLPGMFVRAKLSLDQPDAVLVPQRAATRTPDGGLTVWKLAEDNSVQPTPIKADRAIGDRWLIKDGVAAGDVIVLEGFQKIAPGAVVKPVFAEVEAESADPEPIEQGGEDSDAEETDGN